MIGARNQPEYLFPRPRTVRDFRYRTPIDGKLQIAPSSAAFFQVWQDQVPTKVPVSDRRNRGVVVETITLRGLNVHHRGRFNHSHKGKGKRSHRMRGEYVSLICQFVRAFGVEVEHLLVATNLPRTADFKDFPRERQQATD